jgi:hypothetical protein
LFNGLLRLRLVYIYGKFTFKTEQVKPYLSAGAFCCVAFALEQFYDCVSFVALYLYGSVFDGSAAAAFLFEMGREFFKLVTNKRHAGDHCDALALAAFGLATYADHAVTSVDLCVLRTDALVSRFVATRAHSAVLG